MSQPTFRVTTSLSTHHEEKKTVQAEHFQEVMDKESQDLEWTQQSVDTVVGCKYREDNSGTEKIVIIRKEN